MADSLQGKIQKLRDEHFENVEGERLTAFDQQFRDDAFEFRGRFKAVSSLNRSLSSGLITALMLVEEKKYWKVWGFASFAAYIDSDEVPEFSKSKYYDLKKLYGAEGPEAFDLFTGNRIPISARKLLAARGVEISVDGDDLVIDDQRVPIADTKAVADLVEAVHEALSERDAREEKLTAKVEEQDATIKQGVAELQEKDRALNAMNEQTPFERALMAAVNANLKLVAEIKALDADKKAKRGEGDLKLMAEGYFQARDAFGIRTALAERVILMHNDQPKDDFDAKLDAAIAEDDDLDVEGQD